MKNFNKKQEGFTLAELVVGMAVFIVAVTLIAGLFVRSIKAQRQTNHLMVINSDASLIIERMNREIREGYDFINPSSDSCSNNLTFSRNINGVQQIDYRLNNENIERRQGAGNNFLPLNSSDVSVKDLCFRLVQPTVDDPWRIVISMESGSINPDISYTSTIQTTVTARALPCEADQNATCPYTSNN